MLVIRFNRSGRANNAFFRIVVTESSKPTQSGFIKTLGWYNPHTKDSSINKEEILSYLNNGAQVSNSMAKFLTNNKVSHKLIKFIPDAPGKKKSEPKEEKSKAVQSEEAASKTDEQTPDDTTTEPNPEEVTKPATEAAAEDKTEQRETAEEGEETENKKIEDEVAAEEVTEPEPTDTAENEIAQQPKDEEQN